MGIRARVEVDLLVRDDVAHEGPAVGHGIEGTEEAVVDLQVPEALVGSALGLAPLGRGREVVIAEDGKAEARLVGVLPESLRLEGRAPHRREAVLHDACLVEEARGLLGGCVDPLEDDAQGGLGEELGGHGGAAASDDHPGIGGKCLPVQNSLPLPLPPKFAPQLPPLPLCAPKWQMAVRDSKRFLELLRGYS